MKQQSRQHQHARQRRQAKSRERTGKRPVIALDDSRPEATWMRVPASKGGPGRGAVGLAKHALVLMAIGQTREARHLLTEARRKAPREPELRTYLAATHMLEGDFSGHIWPDVRHVYQGQLTKYR
jgi:hypothetical protein